MIPALIMGNADADLFLNRIDNGIGEQNSFFVVGDFQEPPELAWVATIPHGRVEEFDFTSHLLNNQRRVYVYLPPGYAKRSSQRFATFYIHDGGEYLSRARLPAVLDNLCHSQEIPPLIAVMVDPVDRMVEYHANEQYVQFLEQELIPHIDRHYRTRAERGARGVMGASLGGLISTYLALSRPHLFAKVAGQSSAFFLEQDTIITLAKGLTANISFYFDVGVYEPQFIPAHRQLVPLLQAKGCPCLFQELEGGHNWTNWRAHLKDLLIFLWGKETGEGVKRTPGITKARPPRAEQPGKRCQPAHSGTRAPRGARHRGERRGVTGSPDPAQLFFRDTALTLKLRPFSFHRATRASARGSPALITDSPIRPRYVGQPCRYSS